MPDRERPWSARGAALEAEHGPYADFAAWEQWLSRHCDGAIPEGYDGPPPGFYVTVDGRPVGAAPGGRRRAEVVAGWLAANLDDLDRTRRAPAAARAESAG